MGKTYRQKFVDLVSNVNPLMVVFGMCVLFSILTFIIPGGEFERRAVEIMGVERSVVVPGSFHYVPSVPQGIAQTWTLFMRGAIDGAERSFLIMLSAGALTAIIATNSITAGLHLLISKTQKLGLFFIPILVFAFGLCAATFGMYEEGIPFILVITPLMLTLGFDSMVAVFILFWSIPIGFAAGITNPYNVMIGQVLAGVPVYSGSWFRIISFLVFMSVVSIVIMRYAHLARKDPQKNSLSYDEDLCKRRELQKHDVNPEDSKMTARRALALIMLISGFGVIIYGLMAHNWGFTEIASVFFWMGIIIPLVGGLSLVLMIEKMIEGMRSVMIAVVMMSAACAMSFILRDGKIMDTMLNFLAGYLYGVPHVFIAYIMFGISALCAGIISSASGTAVVVMPILGPLAEVLNFSKQTVVLAFQYATGAFNFWMPWDGILFTVCTMAGVGFFKYIRYTARFAVFIYFPVAIIMLTIAVLVNYQ
ncbi:MAG: Na+/H+ antiporter NhaC family protein [Negativicutes bacterium]|jgi:uncharacterized ion transporter superfamily protein YfcC